MDPDNLRSLLDIFTRGKYQTSEDLPTIPEAFSSYGDRLQSALTEGDEAWMTPEGEMTPYGGESLMSLVMGTMGGGPKNLSQLVNVLKKMYRKQHYLKQKGKGSWAKPALRRPATLYDQNKEMLKIMDDPIYSATNRPLDKMLENYGPKAHSQIRRLINENRAIALDIPERAFPIERAVTRMLKTIEPNTKKAGNLLQALEAEEWEEGIMPILSQLKKYGF
jgi:hypothetical protein